MHFVPQVSHRSGNSVVVHNCLLKKLVFFPKSSCFGQQECNMFLHPEYLGWYFVTTGWNDCRAAFLRALACFNCCWGCSIYYCCITYMVRIIINEACLSRKLRSRPTILEVAQYRSLLFLVPRLLSRFTIPRATPRSRCKLINKVVSFIAPCTPCIFSSPHRSFYFLSPFFLSFLPLLPLFFQFFVVVLPLFQCLFLLQLP